ncbi:DUF5694 domain-containing protein [Sinomicrobium weinanense]|uniref:DUF5694 domain-containing protein n=1 Tax=Sinomicrobium weinanense TaxID=2842200 RepID=UPI001FFCAE56|nr:DUF5694 domain-containing protein [Sinomicrobium weinanense]
MKQTILLLCILFFSCKTANKSHELKKESLSEQKNNKIKVLNFGTFHFGHTPDANKTEFDEHSEEAQKEIREISKMLAEFKPTIICIENLPKFNDEINRAYQQFLDNPSKLNTNYGESSMIGFDVGRLSNVKKIYGIDNHMGYNYSVGDYIERSPELENSIDPKTYLQLTNEPFKDYPEIAKREANYEKLSLLEKLKLSNEPVHLDYSINTNADKLLYVGIGDGFEGADNAAIFYHRNMKIYSNLNRIPMTKNDRVFIIMGTAHTAFFEGVHEKKSKV